MGEQNQISNIPNCHLLIEEVNKQLSVIDTKLTYLRNQALKLEFCKKNILIFKIIFWHRQITDFIDNILLSDELTPEKLHIKNVNDEVQDFLVKHKLVSSCFADFFFSFHNPVTIACVKKLNKLIDENIDKLRTIDKLNIRKKYLLNIIHNVLTELTTLLEITIAELQSFNMSCKNIKKHNNCNLLLCQKLLNKNPELKSVIKPCEEDSPNIITLTIVPEYFQEPGLFDKIISNLEKIKHPTRTLLLIDYNNMCNNRYIEYDWEANNAYKRYQLVSNYVYKIYFINAECIEFGKYYNELKPFIITNRKKQLEGLFHWWLARQMLFDSNIIPPNDYYNCTTNQIVQEN